MNPMEYPESLAWVLLGLALLLGFILIAGEVSRRRHLEAMREAYEARMKNEAKYPKETLR